MKFPNLKVTGSTPYIKMEYDASQQVLNRFIHAILTSPDSAWAFVSKVYSAGLDLNEIRELVSTGITPVQIAAYANDTKNSITRSVYVNNQKVRKLLHIRMVNEPDKNGKWKIFGVEQE